jgi:uncharacterized protein YegP (UPF0339 family)
MATAIQKKRAAMEFTIVEDNDGSFHWTLSGRGAKPLAHSESFGSYKAAATGVKAVRDAAALARFDEVSH